MKKIISVFLLLAFLGNTAGILGLFLILKQDNYAYVFSRSADELNLMHLVIPKSKKIDWEKKNEIIYEGKYYDVFGKSEDDKNVYLLCYSDSKDDTLTQALHKHLSLEGKNAKKKAGPRSSVITLQNYLLQISGWNIHPLSFEKISVQTFNPTLTGFHSVFSPPPDFLV